MALHLPTQAEAERAWRERGFQKQPTKLVEATKDAKDAKAAWERCKKAVDARDKGRCRCCGRKVLKTLTLCAERAEHAHLVRRRKASALMFDPRNVLLLCAKDHGRFDRHELHAVQKAALMFTFDGKSFINADEAIEFKEKP